MNQKPFDATEEVVRNASVITILGELDIATSPKVRELLSAAARDGDRPLVGGDDGAEPGRVDELDLAQIQDQHGGSVGLHLLETLFELRRASNVELADQGYASLALSLLRDDLDRRHERRGTIHRDRTVSAGQCPASTASIAESSVS